MLTGNRVQSRLIFALVLSVLSPRFAQAAGRYRSEVTLSRGGEWVSGRSVLSILSLAAAAGTILTVRAVGEDAEKAVSDLGELLESDGTEASSTD